MIISILLKEWNKLRLYFASLGIILLCILAYFAYDLNFQFQSIEPETMMWYRFAFLDYKPYEYFKWIFFLSASLIALAQFLPEKIKNRIKILTHLPLSLPKILMLHLGVGLAFLSIFSVIFIFICSYILSFLYPNVIVNAFLLDSIFYGFGAMIFYLGLSSAILERHFGVLTLKLFISLFALWIYSQISLNIAIVLWVFIFLFFLLMVMDSLKSVKEQRVDKRILSISGIIAVLILSLNLKNVYVEKYHHQLTKFYIFFSPIKKEFVYQKNFGEHRFIYGNEHKNTFDRKTYESYLPFVYWSDLAMQNKLPILIDNENFTKQKIKKSRLTFGYKPLYLKKLSIDLYPFINAKSDKGIIPFPKEMFYPKKDKFLVFHHDGEVEENLTKILNEKIQQAGLKFPIKNIWGKSTNMKVYDLGYFIKDSKNEIYNLARRDSKISVKKIKTTKNSDIVYMSINENSQKKLAGFAMDDKNKIYLINWDDFSFKPINTKNFNYKTMKFKFISNPKYYLLRYDDGKSYYANVYDKELNLIREFEASKF